MADKKPDCTLMTTHEAHNKLVAQKTGPEDDMCKLAEKWGKSGQYAYVAVMDGTQMIMAFKNHQRRKIEF